MVALHQRNLKLPPDTIIADLRTAIQGHVGNSVKQHLKIERSRVIRNQVLKLECYEVILKDQFTNLYVAFVCTLPDEEDHAVITWVGSDRKGLNKKYSMFNGFSDAMLRHLQDEAFVAFGRNVVAIMKGRTAADGVMLTSEDASSKVIEFPKPEAINQPDQPMLSENKPNPDKTGLAPSAAGASAPNQRAATTDGVYSGTTGEDQSVRGYKAPPQSTSHDGNCLPPVPPIKYGN